MYHTVFSPLLNKPISKKRCGWCGRPIAIGEICRDSTDEPCIPEMDYWHEQQMLEEMAREEEMRVLEEQLHYEENPHLYPY